MKVMKKTALILLAALLSLIVCGCACGGGEAQVKAGESSSSAKESSSKAQSATSSEKSTDKADDKKDSSKTEESEKETKPSDKQESSAEPNVTPEPEEQATEPVRILNADEYVGIYDSDLLAYEDDLGNIYNAEYTVPMLKINSKDANSVNNEIKNKCIARLNESRGARDGRYSLSCTGIGYSTCFYGDILTLLISATFDTGYTDYLVYSFDINSGALMNNEQIAKSVSMDYGSLKPKIKQIMLDYYKEYSSMRDEYAALYNEYRNNTGSDENVENVTLYINDGVLCMHCHIYSLAGADMIQVILPIL